MKKLHFSSGLAVDSIWLAFTKLMTSLISLGTAKLLSVEFSLIDYGTYSQGYLIMSTGAALSILGLADGVNYFYNAYEDEKQRRKNTNTVFLLQCIAGSVCAAVIIGGNGFFTAYFNNPALRPLYIYIMFMPMLSNFLAMYQVLYVSIGKAKTIAVRNLIVSLMKLGAVALATLVTKNVVTIFIVTLITDVSQLVYFAVFFGKKSFWVNPFDIDKSKIKEILLYCLPLAVYILTNSLTRDIDKYVITYFADTESLAIYTNAAKMLPFDMLTSAFATVMIPFITKFVVNDKFEKSRELYSNYLNFAYTTTWMIAFGAVVCSKELMLILYDEKYLAGNGIFIVYILVDMIRFANVAIILRAKGKTKDLMLYSIGMLAANFVLNVLFYKIWGLIGPAIATFAVTFAMNFLMLLQGSKIIHTKLYKLIDFKDMAKLALEIAGAGAIAFGIKYLLDGKDFGYKTVFIVSYGVYAIILFALNIKKVLRLLNNMNRIKAE